MKIQNAVYFLLYIVILYTQSRKNGLMNFEIKSFWFISEMKLKLDTGVRGNLFNGKSINKIRENTLKF